MEKETPITPEDFYHSQAEFNRWLRDLMPHEKSHLKYMLEEYGQMYAEQARREEMERHSEIVEELKGWAVTFEEDRMKHCVEKINEVLGAAGYGKEEA